MNFNSTDFENIEVGTELFMVRYSHAPHPDFVVVKFKSFNKSNGTLEYTYNNKSGKEMSKKTNKQKAMFRFFTDVNEMTRSLFDCFKKRNIDEIPEKYHILIEESQDIRPEIWI